MRGLSLTQPWATLVAIGAKTIETRSWSTPYRGPLAIAAAKAFPRWAQDLCREEPFRTVLANAGFKEPRDLPREVFVGVAPSLKDVLDTEWLRPRLVAQELAFGDYSHDRYGFLLPDVRRVDPPLHTVHQARDGSTRAGGALGLWTVPQDVAELLSEMVA